MSENIRGITFAEQAVTPADDAIVRRAVLGDGALSGCEVTYSGSTLTLAPGFIIACGRAFQITAAQNWAVVDATSGFARLLLTIDLTKTATESTFNQIEFSVEYASAKDGFTELLQDDINISGTKYQIVIAMVSLGTGGITGIVSKLEKAEGGGAGLNFKVVGNPQPTSPSENTIWLNTEVPIASWYFQAEQPENMAEGDVWFATGASRSVEFNALKKNGIQVYPLSAKQMVSGALVDKTAKSWQGGKWVEWILYLYNRGDTCDGITGGWDSSLSISKFNLNDMNRKNAEFGDTSIIFDLTSAGNFSYIPIISGLIDLTDTKTIYIDYTVKSKCYGAFLGVSSSKNIASVNEPSIPANVKFLQDTGAKENATASIDVSGISGKYYIVVWSYVGSGTDARGRFEINSIRRKK